MAYKAKTWSNNEAITADDLNRIERELERLSKKLDGRRTAQKSQTEDKDADK